MRKPIILLLALSALALLPAAASAAKLGGGATTLALDPDAAAALDSFGIAVAPTGAAEAGDDGIAFPITGGNQTGASGVIRHSGGLRLAKGTRKVTLSDFRVVLRDRPFVQVRVGKGKLKAFTLDLDAAEIDDSGIGTTISGVGLELSRQGARALNGVFRTRAFETGLRIGGVTVASTPAFVNLVGGRTDLALDEGAADALASLGISVAGVGPTAANQDGSLGFPITRGRVDAETLAGSIDHDGGISLTDHGTTVTLTAFTVDTRTSTLLARVNGSAERVAILSLDLSAPEVSIAGKDVTVGNVAASLTQAAADALNASFRTDAFKAGLKLGVATVRGVAR